jgi:hypothetical protein
MGVERRRAGFRLPWTADGADDSEAQAADTNGADESARAEIDTPPADPAAAVTEATAATEGAAAGEGASVPGAPAAEEPVTPDTSPTAEAVSAEGNSDEFLQSLVGAMRGVAESSRDASLAELRTAIDTRIETLGTQASERETDIRRQADAELEAVGDWERTEIDRVRTEAEAKREARRAKLEQELAEHRTASEHAVESARGRLAQHENELGAFFSQLSEITDPAAFVAAAKRMPRAPELEGIAPNASAEGTAPGLAADDPRLAALAMSGEAEPPAENAATEAAETSEAKTQATEAETTEPDATEPAEATSEPPETSEPVSSDVAAPTNGTVPPADAQLAERLAQLDERLSGTPQMPGTPAPVATAAPGAETSTAIVVKGLGSFGAITSFKQALERVEGIRGVTLSLGPTGEFVYRASHTGEFDLASAIQTLEGPTASIENTDGTLVVTLSRAR